jgi:hypothetical protein
MRKEDHPSPAPLASRAHEIRKQGTRRVAARQGEVALERHDPEGDDDLGLNELDLALKEGAAVLEHTCCRGDILARLPAAQDGLAAWKTLHGSRGVHQFVEAVPRQSEFIEDCADPLPCIPLERLACPVFGQPRGLADQEHRLLPDAGDDRTRNDSGVALAGIDLVAGKEKSALCAGTQSIVELEEGGHLERCLNNDGGAREVLILSRGRPCSLTPDDNCRGAELMLGGG